MCMLCVSNRIPEAKTWYMQTRQFEKGLIKGLVQRCGHGLQKPRIGHKELIMPLGLRRGNDDQNTEDDAERAFDVGKQPP